MKRLETAQSLTQRRSTELEQPILSPATDEATAFFAGASLWVSLWSYQWMSRRGDTRAHVGQPERAIEVTASALPTARARFDSRRLHSKNVTRVTATRELNHALSID